MKLQIVFMALVKFMGRTKVNNDFLIKVCNTVLRGLVLDVCVGYVFVALQSI